MGLRSFYNHDEHYQRLVLAEIPPSASSALDVGCGDGRYTRALRERGIPRVVGLDRASAVLPTQEPREIEWILGDFMTHDFGAERFDFVMATASIHHMDLSGALHRARALLRPHGRLAVLGLYRSATAADRVCELGAVPVNLALAQWRRTEPTPAPIRPPDLTLAEIRDRASELLPGVRVRRLLLWRYLLTWTASA